MGGESRESLRAAAERALRDNPPPVLLTKADALTFAAQCLDRNASSLSMVVMVLDAMDGAEISDKALSTRIRSYAVEPDLQIAAMKAAVAAIRELALEERVVAARVAREAERGR